MEVWYQHKIMTIFTPISRSHELLEFESLCHFGILDYTNCTYYVIYSEISVVRAIEVFRFRCFSFSRSAFMNVFKYAQPIWLCSCNFSVCHALNHAIVWNERGSKAKSNYTTQMLTHRTLLTMWVYWWRHIFSSIVKKHLTPFFTQTPAHIHLHIHILQ